MEDKLATHILLTFPSQKTSMLFRADDGICLGQCQKETLIWGDEPNKRRSHVFIDHEHALRHLRDKVTAEDLKARDIAGEVVIEDRNGEHTLILPDSSIELGGIAPATTIRPIRN